MEAAQGDRLRSAAPVVRAGLVVFVLAWLFGLFGLRSAVPIWLPFLVALGLELQFFLGARRAEARRPDRLPQDVDRDLYGYADEEDELVLVRRGDDVYWVPYSGQTPEELDTLVDEAAELEPEAGVPPAARRRRPVRGLFAGLGVIAALAAVVWVAGRGGWDGLDADARAAATARFSAEASRIVGRPVTIRCDESGSHVGAVQHADGAAIVGGQVAYLTPERCLDLYRLAFKDDVAFSQTARAIAVLAHESWHLRGVRNEATTECYALQSGVELGQRLGLSERTSRQMMRQQLAENALHAGSSAEYLVSAGCRNGGSLDLHPNASAFP